MKHRASLLLLLTCIAGPALAQHEDHAATPAETETDAHAQHTTPAPAAVEPDVHAEHTTPAPAEAEVDPHAGHVMPAPVEAEADQHAEHAAAEPGTAALRDQPPPPEAFEGTDHAADLIYGRAEMAVARNIMLNEHGVFRSLFAMADQLEMRNGDGDEYFVWDAQAWYGGDIDKLWFKTEGESGLSNAADAVELQALWSHAIHPWFDFQAGVRADFASGFERSHLVLGVQGLAPYSVEVDAAAFISDDGDVSARFEGEYDVWLTQRLVLQPRIEFEMAMQDIPERGIGSGLSSAEFGARLHYQVAREFAPYLGVEYERLVGGTKDVARLNGDDTEGWSFVLGVRSWF